MNSEPDFSFGAGNFLVNPSSSVVLTDSDLDSLREAVRPFYTEKRYFHVLGVERAAKRLGEVFLPCRINALRVAALLHDITKKFDLEKQLKCCADFGIIIKPPYSPEVLHAVTAPLLAAQEFPMFVDGEILGGIRFHTTGRWGMTVFEAIVFLADYIEPGRTHKPCVDIRNELYSQLSENGDGDERILNRTVLKVLDSTIAYLLEKNVMIDPDTVSARNYYLSEKEL